jgi:hypothetical protein
MIGGVSALIDPIEYRRRWIRPTRAEPFLDIRVRAINLFRLASSDLAFAVGRGQNHHVRAEIERAMARDPDASL